jgi:nicotinate-nucleotide adenylyltransferase
MRIGLYGGSFDPVHLGHLLVAQAALEEMRLDRIYFIPAAQSPFKPERKLTPNNIRLQMLRTALVGRTYCEIDTQELERGGVSYSIDTVREYAKRFAGAELFYLIGGDHVGQLPKWRDADELARRVTFLVIPRPGEPPQQVAPPFRAEYLKGFPIAVSASQIRERVRRQLPVELLVGGPVAETIRYNDLYLS